MENIHLQNTQSNPEQMVLAAHKELNAAITKHQIEILKLIPRLERIGGTPDYNQMILAILKEFQIPLPLSSLTWIISDHAALTAARKELIQRGLIEELSEKNRKMLRLKESQY
jgi:hypothetical protein